MSREPTERDSPPGATPTGLDTTPASPPSQLLAELQLARERAVTAARLVLELNSRLETAGIQRIQLRQSLAHMQADLEAHSRQIAALRQELAEAQRQNIILRDELAAAHAAGAASRAERDVPRQQLHALEQAAAAITNRLSQPTDLAQTDPVVAAPCPHLGLKADRETRHGFASDYNRCYARGTALEVTIRQQVNFCLRASHHQCPVFTGALRAPKEPIDTDPQPARHALLSKIWRDKK